MKIINILVVALLAFSLNSCKKAMSADEINEKAASGVVLIMNYFYYSVTLPSGETIYFNGIRDGELVGLTGDEDEARENCSGASGTGFFISQDGLIMTNRHVASPDVSEAQVKAFLKDLKRALKQKYGAIMGEALERYSNSEGNPGLMREYVDMYNSYKQARDAIDDMDMNDADIATHTNLFVVYNGSHITKAEDLIPCETVAVSEDEGVDLALIQLKDEETPEGKYIFTMSEDDSELSMDQKLFMIGFNRGLTIARTSEGEIQSQMYTGHVTQKGDGSKILYSIPSQHGSSGSPVVNEQCEVVAVNFAGWDDTQGFNYGIPLKKVKQFLKDN